MTGWYDNVLNVVYSKDLGLKGRAATVPRRLTDLRLSAGELESLFDGLKPSFLAQRIKERVSFEVRQA